MWASCGAARVVRGRKRFRVTWKGPTKKYEQVIHIKHTITPKTHTNYTSTALSFSAQHTAALWCPLYIRIASPDAQSHSLALASLLAVTRYADTIKAESVSLSKYV